MDLKVGDKVRITEGPIDKVDMVGTVKLLATNGVFILLDDGRITPVQFGHLEKEEP